MSGHRGILHYGIGLLAFLAAVFLVSAFLSPPAFWVVDGLFPERWPFKRVFNRVLMLSALVGLWPLLRYWGVRSWERVGVCRWRELPRQFGIWFAMGFATLAVLTALRIGLGVTTWQCDLEAVHLLSFAFSALAVGCLEELLFRGGLCRSFSHLGAGGRVAAVVLGSAFFATAHFLKARPLPGDVGWLTGWQTWIDMLGQFERGTAVAGHWLTLFLAGAILCVLVLRQGHLWGAIGLHAGWVFTLKLSYKVTEGYTGSPLWFGENVLTGLSTCLVLLFLLIGVAYDRRV